MPESLAAFVAALFGVLGLIALVAVIMRTSNICNSANHV